MLANSVSSFKNLLTAIDTLLEIKEHRRQALSLLCTFVRFQPPHLYQVVRTSLLDHLLQCLMIDTSTTTISLALLSLVMLLPHIPGSLVPYLPRLFIVYSRLLCWDIYYGPRPTQGDGSDTPPANGDGESDENSSSVWSYTDPTWDKLHSSFNVADATIRDLTPYFSFLYGLYPENFMGFIRKPNRYLRNARFPGLDRLELDQEAIRRLTERYRRVHLIHLNFYTMTVEAELSDLSRFLHCEPSDIVAQCMGLCIIAAPISADTRPHQIRSPAPVSMQAATPAAPNDIMIPTADTPSRSASTVDGEEDPPPLPAAEENEPEQKPSDGDGQPADDRRSTTSATRDFDSVAESFALRKETQMDIGQTSGDLTSNTPAAEDSPTLPLATVVRQTESPVREMLQTQELLRSMFRSSQAEGNGAESTSPSLAPSSPRLTAYVHTLATMPDRSPAIRPVSADPRRDIVLLQREVLLLRNDLNFERFLKQQHLSHIGQLQRKYIQDATSEADTQNLIQANRALKVKAEEARRAYSTLKKETAAGRSHAKKWETELNGRTRALREQQKRWEIEEQHLRHELHTTRDAAERLRRLLLESEAKELAARQKVETLQGTVEELEKMRRELDTLDQRLRAYERREQEFEQARRNEQMAYAQLETARLRLQARDVERERMQKAYEERVGELEARLRSAEMGSAGHNAQSLQAMIDSALASSRSRFENLRRLYNRLLTRHSELEIAYMDLQSAVELNGSVAARKDLLVRSPAELDIFADDALSGTAAAAATAHSAVATTNHPADSSSAPASRRATHSEPVATYDEFLAMPYRPSHLGPTSASAPARPTGLGLHDTSPLSDYVGLPELQSSTYKKHSSDGTNFSGASVRSGSRSDHAPDGKKKQKIKPTSGVRVYGRGGSDGFLLLGSCSFIYTHSFQFCISVPA
jgi:hypothetical protein